MKKHLFSASAVVAALSVLPAVAGAPAEVWGVSTKSAFGGVAGASPLAAADSAGNLYVVSTTGDRSGACIVTLKYAARDGAVAWRREACGGFFTFGRAVAVDSAGDVVVVGSTSGDTRIVKYSGRDGAVAWDQQPGVAQGFDAAYGVALNASGDAFVFGTVALASVDLRVMKLAAATGNIAWSRTFDNGGEETPAGIAVDRGGNVVIASHFLNARNDEDWHVAKLAGATGATTWQRNIDSGRRDVAVGLALDGAGNAIVAGTTSASPSVDVIRTVRFGAADGAIAWDKTFGSGGFSGAAAIRADSDGNAFVTGHAAVASGNDDIVTLKYTAGGVLAWQSRFAGTRAGLEAGRAIALDSRGDVTVTGISYTEGQAGSDIRTLKYDGGNGGEMWSAAYRGGGAGGEDSGFSVVAVAGAVYAVGVATEPATPSALRVAKFGDSSVAAPDAVNVQGLWWNGPGESGWGVNLTQQGAVVFATWFTYDTDGSGMWLVMSRGESVGRDMYAGDLYRTSGPPLGAGAFDPTLVTLARVGRATFAFTDGNNGSLEATVNGASISKRITRQVYAASVPVCTAAGAAGAAPNHQALWWSAPAGAESGWGLNITDQGGILFATWFTYGAGGKGQWLVASRVEKDVDGSYSGTLYRTRGPAYNAARFDPAAVTNTSVGTIRFTFSAPADGTLTATVDGMTVTKAITRQVFASPETFCR